jgi:hypothetical protein
MTSTPPDLDIGLKSNHESYLRHCRHFVHALQFYYVALDIALSCPARRCCIATEVRGRCAKGRLALDQLLDHCEKAFVNVTLASNVTAPRIATHDPIELHEYGIGADWPSTEHDPPDATYNVKARWLQHTRTATLLRESVFGPDPIPNHDMNNLSVGVLNRPAAFQRQLLNVDEGVRKLRTLPFVNRVDVSEFTSDHTFEYQTRFFRDHDVVISPHGAQLAWSPFMVERGLIIELQRTDTGRPPSYFSSLSAESQQSHVLVLDRKSCDDTQLSQLDRNQKRRDMTIDWNDVIATIERYRSADSQLSGIYPDVSA